MVEKSQSTSISERSNIEHDLWRKKVDNTLFRYRVTAIPIWIASRWELNKHFRDVKGKLGKNDKGSQTTVKFRNKVYEANLTSTLPKNSSTFLVSLAD